MNRLAIYFAALALGVAAMTGGASAAPSGLEGAKSPNVSTSIAEKVHWRRYRHCHWRRGYRRCHGHRYYRRWGGPGFSLYIGPRHRYGRHRYRGWRWGW